MASWPSCFDHVFRRLKGVVGSGGGGWYAFCPAHDDKRSQSLTVKVNRSGNLMMNCHAGCACSIKGILSALDLTFDDLFADNRYYNGDRRGKRPMAKQAGKRAEGVMECAYPYHDEDSGLLFEVVRFRDPKEFRQRRPNPEFDSNNPPSANNKQWLWNLTGVRRVPYRLPQLLADMKARPNEPVALVEGEKDVDKLREFGIIATTVPGGAGKWHLVADEFVKVLRGRKVAVVADDDPVDEKVGYKPGLRHAVECCTGLYPVAESVKLVRLFDDEKKKDASDWVIDQLMKADETPMKLRFWKQVRFFPQWNGGGSIPPGAYPPNGDAATVTGLFRSETEETEIAGAATDLFGERLDAELSKQRAKLRGPVNDRDAIIGRLARLQAILHGAANERSDERFLTALASIAAFARIGGEGVGNV